MKKLKQFKSFAAIYNRRKWTFIADGKEYTPKTLLKKYPFLVFDGIRSTYHGDPGYPKDVLTYVNDALWKEFHGYKKRVRVYRLSNGERVCAPMIADKTGVAVSTACKRLSDYERGTYKEEDLFNPKKKKYLNRKKKKEDSESLKGLGKDLRSERLLKIPGPTRLERKYLL